MNQPHSDRSQARRELLIFALGELICLALVYGVYALLHRLDSRVLLGGAVGALVTVLNYFLMALGVFRAADKARSGDVAGGRRVMSLSLLGRYGLMLLVLIAAGKSGYCDMLAAVIPLALSRIIIYAGEFFRGKDG